MTSNIVLLAASFSQKNTFDHKRGSPPPGGGAEAPSPAADAEAARISMRGGVC